MTVHLTIVSAYPAAQHVPDWTAAGIIGLFLVVLPLTAWAFWRLVDRGRRRRAERAVAARQEAEADPWQRYAHMAAAGERTGGRR